MLVRKWRPKVVTTDQDPCRRSVLRPRRNGNHETRLHRMGVPSWAMVTRDQER